MIGKNLSQRMIKKLGSVTVQCWQYILTGVRPIRYKQHAADHVISGN